MLVAAKVTSSVSANHREPLCYTPFSPRSRRSTTHPHCAPDCARQVAQKAGELARVTIGSGSLPWG